MKLAEEVLFLIKLHEKCEKFCQPANVEPSYTTEVDLLLENKLISAEAAKTVRGIYSPTLARATMPTKTTITSDPCSSSFSGTRRGGC